MTKKTKEMLLAPVTPGEILLHQFLQPLEVTQSKLARDIDVPVTRINSIVKGERAVTVDTALRLGKYFNTSPQLWLNLQSDYELQLAEQNGWKKIESTIRPLKSKVKNKTKKLALEEELVEN